MPDEDVKSVPYYPLPRAEVGAPKLSWQRGEALEEPTAAAPLYIQERIHPSEFVRGLIKDQPGDAQESLFGEFNSLPSDAQYRWYQHHGNWSNRLIRGPSLEVMASLIVKDDLAGKVQCIYFDPPYGISFKSLYQQSTRSRNVAKDAGSAKRRAAGGFSRLVREKACIPTWTPSTALQLTRAKLLTESGSFFMQISQENVHRVALVLDEVFGADSRIATIMFAKSGSTPSNTLPQVNDYLLWYAKDKMRAKYRPLYEPLSRKEVIKHFNWDVMLELSDGTTRSISNEERDNPDGNLPAGSRLFRRMPLLSSDRSTTGRSEPFDWEGRTFPCPGNQHWRVSPEGLQRLGAYSPHSFGECGRRARIARVEAVRRRRFQESTSTTCG